MNLTWASRTNALLFLVLAFPSWVLALPSWVPAGACPEEKRRVVAIRERIEREWPLRTTDPVVQYVRNFGRKLAQRANVERAVRWRFEVVRDTSVNAFSIGDGLIYVTEGAILAAADESELAAILAHEMGHQLAGHFCADAISSEKRKPWWEILFSPIEPAPSMTSAGQHAHLGSLRRGVDPAKEGEAERLAADILHSADYAPVTGTTLTRNREHSPATEAAPGLLAPSVEPNLSPPPNAIHQPSAWQVNHELRKIQALLRQEL